MDDPFAPLPPTLQRELRAYDDGLRKELRVVGLGLMLVGVGLGLFIAQYVVRMGRALEPRTEEWAPLLACVASVALGGWLRRVARAGGFMRALVTRFPEVVDVRLEQRRRKYGFGLWLVFELPGRRTERMPLGDNVPPSEPRAQQLLAEARHACGK